MCWLHLILSNYNGLSELHSFVFDSVQQMKCTRVLNNTSKSFVIDFNKYTVISSTTGPKCPLLVTSGANLCPFRLKYFISNERLEVSSDVKFALLYVNRNGREHHGVEVGSVVVLGISELCNHGSETHTLSPLMTVLPPRSMRSMISPACTTNWGRFSAMYRYVSSRIYRCCAFNPCVLKLEAGEKFSFIAVGTFKSFWYNIKWFFISCNLLEKFIEFLATVCGKSANVNPLENFNFIPEILRKNTRKKLLIAFLFFYSVKKILFKTIDDRYRINSSYSCNTLHRWFFFLANESLKKKKKAKGFFF